MILLLGLAAIAATTTLSLLTACAVTVRALTAPALGPVGSPPPGSGAVSLASRTGHRIAGWFAPGEAGRGAVLLVHGIRSDRRSLASRMTCLTRAGVAVLAIDLRAHGESAGRAITLGHLEAEDVAGAMAWLREALPGEKVGAIGVSLGGASLLLASRHVAIDALVLESVFPDIRAAIRNRLRGVVGPAQSVVMPVFMAVGIGLTGLRPSALRPIEALRTYAGPVLVISGAEDLHTTPAETRALFEAAAGPKALWMVEGAGHVDMAAAAGSDYEGRILDFLAPLLRRAVPCA